MKVYLVRYSEYDGTIFGKQVYPKIKEVEEQLVDNATISFCYTSSPTSRGFSCGSGSTYVELTPRFCIFDFDKQLDWFINVLENMYGSLDIAIYIS